MNIIEKIKEEKIVVIVRGIEQDDCLAIAEALIRGGMCLLEVTMNTEGALSIITKWREHFKNEDVYIGAGTVLNSELAVAAIDAGAQFIITPNVDEDVIRIARKHHVTIIPGAMSPTEIMDAIKAGADAVKLFPIDSLGIQYLKEIKASLSSVKVLATGGISLNNICEYLNCEVIGVGIGSSIVDKGLIEKKDYKSLTKLAETYVNKVKGG